MSDPVFDTDLQQRSLVEASAGTGKTYALAGMFARAVIVDRLRVPQVLAVTYTVAATQELHARVRLRLQQALALAQQWQDGDDDVRADDAPHTAMLRRLLHQALHGEPHESLPALRQRLARALGDMDLAAIATIHGFCQRVLREHALQTRQPLLPSTLETANATTRERLAAELWRALSVDIDGADFLRRRFGRLEALASALYDLLAPEPLLPPSPPILDDPRPALVDTWQHLSSMFAKHGASARAAIKQAIADAVLKKNEYKPEHVSSLWHWLDANTQGPTVPESAHPKLHKYLPETLEKGTYKAKTGQAPQSPLFAAISPCIEAMEAVEQWQQARDLQHMHVLRTEAQRRDRQRKLAFNLRDHDDLIGDLHAAVEDASSGERLAQALRRQFPCVLVDEFQDTDARQWDIFKRLFGDGSLVLVGDPKQAIYRFRGGDVNTYVAAAETAQRSATLDRNFRSRPCLIAAVNHLFEQQMLSRDLLGEGIDFLATQPGSKATDADLLVEGHPAPALHFHVVPATEEDKDWTKPRSISIAAALCADAIAKCLQQAGAGNAQRRDLHTDTLRPLQPRDVAVLVRDHHQATAIRHALSLRGVPAVASGKQSLYAGEEAQDLLALLLAVRSPGDDRRLRAALATVLLGWDAAGIVALDDDGDALREWQQTLVAWRSRWERHGPQAMLAEVLAANVARLLQREGGERRLTNTLQLAELQQASAGRNLGTQGQVDALRDAIIHADGGDETQQPRLESDAGRVQILTLHKSKGLEFPLVYLPFVGIGRMQAVKGMALYTDADGRRVRQWKTTQPFDALPWDEAKARHLEEDAAEEMRLLYVGLTRASEAVWLCCGHLSQRHNASLHRLLDSPAPLSELLAALGDSATCDTGLQDETRIVRLPAPASDPAPQARIARRRLQRDWWIHSFSQLHRQQSQGTGVLVDARPADDEVPLAITATPQRPRVFAGARFGNVLHHALEHVDFATWRDHVGALPPAGQATFLTDALASQGYAEKLHDAGIRELTPLVSQTLNATLPEGARLCELAPEARIAELEFHLALRGASTEAMLDLLHRHALLPGRHDFGVWTRLSGLMNGKIDLTYRHAGCVYVMDYKSNDLSDYDPASLSRTMTASEYDLQALLYTLAVHRWMQLRMGAGYDYERDFGGVRYVFCRGLDTADAGRGIHVPRFPRALVEAVDALLLAPTEQAA